MTARLQTINQETINDFKEDNNAFKLHVLEGLSKKDKALSSMYFYDDKGSELFNKITKNPEYYPTNCEIEILDNNKEELSSLLVNEPFNLVELGPGEGIKPRLLIDQFLADSRNFSYYPIDISVRYLRHLIENFNDELPELEAIALNSDYLNGLNWLNLNSKRRNFVLFLGSSIGNFSLKDSEIFLHNLRSYLNPGDYLLIGFDRLKKVDTLLAAYNDKDGLTKAFNLNLLTRINRELGANFDLNSFQHYGCYNVYTGAMESYLLSSKAQIVYIDTFKRSFGFKKLEPIYVESSQKYSLNQIEKLARVCEFKLIKNFTDKKHYFLNSLWRV